MKKVLTLSIATLFIFLASGIVANINADEWTEKVVADKKFEINKNAKLVVDHEFGNVRCKNWNQNSISVKVTVKAKTKDAKKIELEMMEIFDEKDWVNLTHLVIDHGRSICIARRHQCGDCVLVDLCPSSSV
jgi:hypothetical protein